MDNLTGDNLEIINKNNSHFSLLELVTNIGTLEMLKFLCETHREQIKNYYCQKCDATLLMLAAANGKSEMIEFLIKEIKVDPFQKNQQKKDVYDIALSYNNEDLAMHLELYLNEQLNFQDRKKILFMRKKGQKNISKIPKNLFNNLLEYF